MNELKKRVLSGAAMAIACGLIIYFANQLLMTLFLLLLVGIMSWEWAGMVIAKHHGGRWLYALLCLILVGCIYWHTIEWQYLPTSGLIGVWWWLFVPFFLIAYRGCHASQWHRWLDACIGPLLFLLFFSSFLMLWQVNHHLVVLWIALACGSDTGGYFAGKFFGRHRLIPAVSPNKTWEGALGGVFTSCAIAVVGFWWLSGNIQWLSLAIGAIAAVTTIIGDAYISLQKRKYDLKDTGQLIPGHGGILDRLDGLLATLPIGWWLMHAGWLTHLTQPFI
ncbi:phosphatidate cytidylyltransferase [Gammaproteobacteria bacterium]|nr:phosphatidate cytidylyltransferase [Gammaproteobacteria bacterium]